MGGKFSNCCCNNPPPCRVFQVNAIKAHGGIPGNEAPWIGSWTSIAGSDAATVQYVESNTLYLASPFTWPAYQPHVACGTTRFLRYVEDGFSNHPVDLPPNTVVPIYWHCEIIWDRQTGLVTSAVFTVNYNGGGDETYWSATLNETTGVYTVVDNTATAHTPTWQTVDSTAFAGGSATININEDGASFEYIIPDTGHGLGPTTQSLTITLSERYSEGDAADDCQGLLDLINLGNIPTGDSTGTFVPLEPNTEYTVGYEAWPVEVVALQRTYYQADAFSSCTTNTSIRPVFPPFISKIYGSKSQIYAVLYGDTATFDGLNFPGRLLNDSYLPTEPATSGTWPNYPGPPTSYFLPVKWVFMSKLRASPEGESACLAQREQQFCDCTPINIYIGYECSADNFLLTTVTDCDALFYNPEFPANTCDSSHQSDICLNPGDMLFEYGVAILYPQCRFDDYPECHGIGIAPACCNT